MVSEFVLGQTQTNPQDHFLHVSKHTQNRPQLISIKHSSRDGTKQTNPEIYNRPTQQILNLAT